MLQVNKRSFDPYPEFDAVQPGQSFWYMCAGMDKEGNMTPWAVAGPFYRNHAPLQPSVISPIGRNGVNGLWTGIRTLNDPDNHAKTLQYRTNNGPWRDVLGATNLIGGRTIAMRVPETATYDFRCVDVMGLVSDSVRATYTIEQMQFTDQPLVPWATPVKALHIQELRMRITEAAALYGAPAPVWGEEIVANRTSYRGFTEHVNEMRAAIEAIIATLNSLGAGLIIVPPTWIKIPEGRPYAAALTQLRNVIDEL